MEQFPRKPSRADRAIESIDRGLEEARNINLDTALDEAIAAGRMTIREAEECREAYFSRLHRLPNPPEHPDLPPAA